MPVFHVHRFDVVRIKVAVEAANQAGAMRAADAYLAQCHPIHARQSGMDGSQYPCPKWLGMESAEEITGYLVDVEGDTEYEQSRFFEKNGQPSFDPIEDQTDFPTEDWRFEVANGDTRLGSEEWVSNKRAEQAAENAPEIITGNGQYRAGKGEIVSSWHDSREAAIAEYYELLTQRADAETPEEITL